MNFIFSLPTLTKSFESKNKNKKKIEENNLKEKKYINFEKKLIDQVSKYEISYNCLVSSFLFIYFCK